MSYSRPALRPTGSALAGGLTGPRTGDGPQPHVLVVGSGASHCGTTLSTAILAVSAAALGRDLLAVDATRSGALLPLLGAPSAAYEVRRPAAEPVTLGPTLSAADVEVNALTGVFETPAVAAGRGVIVDAGARLGNVLGALAAARAASLAPALLVVTGTAPAQIAASYALVKVAAERGLTTNTELLIVGAEPAEAREAFALLAAGVRRFLGRPLALAAHVPEDSSLAVALAAGMSVADAAAGSPAATAFAPLAARWTSARTAASVPAPMPVPSAVRRPAVPGLSGPLAFAAAPAR